MNSTIIHEKDIITNFFLFQFKLSPSDISGSSCFLMKWWTLVGFLGSFLKSTVSSSGRGASLLFSGHTLASIPAKIINQTFNLEQKWRRNLREELLETSERKTQINSKKN